MSFFRPKIMRAMTRRKSAKALHEEFNQLLVEKKQAYAEYRQVKKDMQEYLIAKQTVETILNIDKKKEQEKEQKKPLR